MNIVVFYGDNAYIKMAHNSALLHETWHTTWQHEIHQDINFISLHVENVIITTFPACRGVDWLTLNAWFSRRFI